jgi:hypothetical protein
MITDWDEQRAEYTRMRVEQIRNRVADFDKRREELARQSVRRNDYPTPGEQAERMARVERLMQERLGTAKPVAVEPVDLRDFDQN